MLKKRLIFTLLYDAGHFVLSRNFRLQKVGNIDWLRKNYDFSKISFAIDELVVLDVTRGPKNLDAFCDTLKLLCEGCFVPVAAGGGVRTPHNARALLRSGADKVVINTLLHSDLMLVNELAREFGDQCIVGSVDVKRSASGSYSLFTNSGSTIVEGSLATLLQEVLCAPIGELYLNSIDRDGTGGGYDLGMLDLLPDQITKPLIIAGGVGNASHFLQGFADKRVDAVATANLFNFVGDGLQNARDKIIAAGVSIPAWSDELLLSIHIDPQLEG